MDTHSTRLHAPSSKDTCDALDSIHVKALEAKLTEARSEINKANATVEIMLDVVSSRAKPNQSQLSERHEELNFLKEIQHLKRELELAHSKVRSAKVGFEGLFDIVVTIKSDLSEANVRELGYIKEITRLNVMLQKMEADRERLKNRYRAATHAKAGEIAGKYSQERLIIATSDGEVQFVDESMEVGTYADDEMAKFGGDMDEVEVETSSAATLDADKANSITELFIINIDDTNTTISGAGSLSNHATDSKEASMINVENGANSKVHILDSPIEEGFNQIYDHAIAAEIVHNFSENGDKTGLVAVDDPLVSLGPPTSSSLIADKEFTIELQDIDFLDLEDILDKEPPRKPLLSQDNSSTICLEKVGIRESLNGDIDADADKQTAHYKDDEYLDPNLVLHTIQYISSGKGDTIFKTDFPPTVLQVGSDTQKSAISGGRYTIGRVAKGSKYFPSRALTDSKSSTNLGPFDSIREREAAIRSNRRHAGRHDRAFPDIFRHGIFYQPSPTDKNVYRTLHIGNLPLHITPSQLLARIRGGALVSAFICDTVAITGSKSAIIVFRDESAAIAYAHFAAKYPIVFEYQRAEVTLLRSPTWPMSIPAQKRIEELRQTRCLNIQSFIKPYSGRLTTSEKEKRNQQMINTVTGYVSGCCNQKSNVVHDVYLDDKNTLHLTFTSIQAAGIAYGILQKEKYKEFGNKTIFVADPCARPLEDLFEILDAEVYQNNVKMEEENSQYGPSFISDEEEDDDLSHSKAPYKDQKKLYDCGHLQKNESITRSSQISSIGRRREKYAAAKVMSKGFTVLDDEAIVSDKLSDADVEHLKAGVTNRVHATKGGVIKKPFNGLSAISNTLLSENSTSQISQNSSKSPVYTPGKSHSSTPYKSFKSLNPILITPTQSDKITSLDTSHSNSDLPITNTDKIDLCLTKPKAISSTVLIANSTPTITERDKYRSERQSWADIMIEEAEMEQTVATGSLNAEAKSSSGPATPLSSGSTFSKDKSSKDVTSPAPSSAPTTKVECPICSAGQKTATGTDTPVVFKMFCVPAPDTDSGPMARLTNAGIGGMQACSCDGKECCVSGCLCRHGSTD